MIPFGFRTSWLRERLIEQLEYAVARGMRRVYKHRDDAISDDARDAVIEAVVTAVTETLDDALEYGSDDGG